HAEGVTILLVEQNVSRALDLADRVYVLTNGVMTANGTPDQIRDSVDIETDYLGGAGSNSMDADHGWNSAGHCQRAQSRQPPRPACAGPGHGLWDPEISELCLR